MPVPEISEDEILVKVIASGICGSDVLEWYRIKKAPLVLGHEIAGEIVKVGVNVKKYKPGDRVFVSHHVPCNTCHYCITGHHTACETLHTTNFYPGGFSEYIRVPPINVDRGIHIIPDEMSYDEGTFIEPLGCVIRGQKLVKILPDQSILVLGSGISGILHIKLAAAFGAGKIIATDIHPYRIEAAKKAGADFVFKACEFSPEKLRECNDGRLADLAVICTEALPAAYQALESVDRGGTILFFAVPHPDDKLEIPINKFWRNEIKMVTSYAVNINDLTEAIEMIRAKRVTVKDMITHKFPLAETLEGSKLIETAGESLKVIIEPQR
jgi:L-iditol 2-dehydrogenase